MDQGDLIVRKDGQVLHVTIRREKALNALNRNILEKLAAVFEGLEDDNTTRVVVITGFGRKAFVAGADVREIKDAGAARTEFIRMGQNVFYRIMTSPKVVIAAVNGYALGGGCELALACDIRIASESASIGMPEAGIGVMPGYGGTQCLFTPFLLGAVRMLEAGIATRDEIDISMKFAVNHPKGPLEVVDFIGLDTELSIANSLYEETKDPKYAPPLLLIKMVTAGWLGRKSGKGFYDYK
jgi:enoyl-CoA hydratase/carnithine racemase